MAAWSLVLKTVVLLSSAVLLTGEQHTTEAPSTTEPYVVAIHKSNATSKTAVIKPSVVLTTATCFDRAESGISVTMAANNRTQHFSVGNDVKFIKHPKISDKRYMLDLALLKLKTKIKMIVDMVGPLLETNVGPVNGWNGTQWLLQPPFTQLSRSGVPTPCADDDSQICTSFTEHQACAKDSEGGVLACNGNVVGIFSEAAGHKKCTKERLGFVDVTKHYDWINVPAPMIPMDSSASSESPLRILVHVTIATALSAMFCRF